MKGIDFNKEEFFLPEIDSIQTHLKEEEKKKPKEPVIPKKEPTVFKSSIKVEEKPVTPEPVKDESK